MADSCVQVQSIYKYKADMTSMIEFSTLASSLPFRGRQRRGPGEQRDQDHDHGGH